MPTIVDKNAYKSLIIAATAENYYYSKNDNPCTVIIKEMAKTVVVHSMFLQSWVAVSTAHLHIMLSRSPLLQKRARVKGKDPSILALVFLLYSKKYQIGLPSPSKSGSFSR